MAGGRPHLFCFPFCVAWKHLCELDGAVRREKALRIPAHALEGLAF